jgi:hypothetical protein
MDARAGSEDKDLSLDTRIIDLTKAVSSAHCAVAARDSTAATIEMLSELEEKLEVAGKLLSRSRPFTPMLFFTDI